jgi:hypothetical protein
MIEANSRANEDGPMAKETPSTIPAAALARHVEWLDVALGAARDEETRRQGRLERATDKNRDRRTAKLAAVSAEVRELDALVRGIRDLQARAARADGRQPAAVARKSSRAARTARPAAAEASPATPRRRGRRPGAAKRTDQSS